MLQPKTIFLIKFKQTTMAKELLSVVSRSDYHLSVKLSGAYQLFVVVFICQLSVVS